MQAPQPIRMWLNRLQHLFLPSLAIAGALFALLITLHRPQAAVNMLAKEPATNHYARAIAGIGVLEPKSETIDMGVDLPGIVRQVLVKPGDQVKQGQALISLDQRDIDAQITLLQASLVSTELQAKDAGTQFELIASVTDKRAIAKDDFNRRYYAKLLAEAKVKELQAQLHVARTTKQRLTISAPIDGTILQLSVQPGEYLASNATEPLVRMGDLSQLYVRVEIDEEFGHDLNPKANAYAIARGKTDDRIPLRYVRTEPLVRPKTNLAVAGQRVDTRVTQVIYALETNTAHPPIPKGWLIGQQMDVFVEAHEKQP